MHRNTLECTIFIYRSPKIFWEGYSLLQNLPDVDGINHLPQNPVYPFSTLLPLNRSSKSKNIVSISTQSALPEMLLPPGSVGWLCTWIRCGYGGQGRA